jgi:hypothetical protein
MCPRTPLHGTERTCSTSSPPRRRPSAISVQRIRPASGIRCQNRCEIGRFVGRKAYRAPRCARTDRVRRGRGRDERVVVPGRRQVDDDAGSRARLSRARLSRVRSATASEIETIRMDPADSPHPQIPPARAGSHLDGGPPVSPDRRARAAGTQRAPRRPTPSWEARRSRARTAHRARAT